MDRSKLSWWQGINRFPDSVARIVFRFRGIPELRSCVGRVETAARRTTSRCDFISAVPDYTGSISSSPCGASLQNPRDLLAAIGRCRSKITKLRDHAEAGSAVRVVIGSSNDEHRVAGLKIGNSDYCQSC